MTDRRPVRHRRAARILMLAEDQVLLQQDSDPGLPGSKWWVLPGGGLDEGESFRAAAVREAFEETGLQITEDQLDGPILQRRVVHGYSDQVLTQDEQFFCYRGPRFEARPEAWTEQEYLCLQDMGWHSIHALPRPIWPAKLPELIKHGRIDQIELVEESTVPISHVQRSQAERWDWPF